MPCVHWGGEFFGYSGAPTLVADSVFLGVNNPRNDLGRLFYLAIPVGTSLGYILGVHNLAQRTGWRARRFILRERQEFFWRLRLRFLPEPPRTGI